MNFHRENEAEFSLVEKAVLRALDVARFDFKPVAARRTTTPQWVLQAQQQVAATKNSQPLVIAMPIA